MVILCGIPSEPALLYVGDALEERGASYGVLNQRHFADWRLEVDAQGDGLLWLGAQAIPTVAITAVYLRLMDHTALPEAAGASELCARRHDELYAWLELTGLPVVNRPSTHSSNVSKPFQIQRIGAAGLAVPETLVTDDVEAVLAFEERVGPLIFKAASGARTIVRRFDATADLSRIAHCPVQFQRRIDGVDVRVHRVGDELFPTAVRSEASDYRYAHDEGLETELTTYEIDAPTAAACLAAADALELPLAGIDLRIDADGRAHCFEVNPSPSFTYYENATGQPIAAAIARLLCA